MKKKTVAVLLTGVLAMSVFLGGCGKKETEEQNNGSPLSVVTEQPDTEDTPDYLAPGVEFPEDAESMVPVMQALMASAYTETDAEYYNEDDSELDREYFWECVRYLASMENADSEDGVIDKEDVVKYAKALFGNYDVDAKGLPQIPDSCRELVTFQGYNGTYTFELLSTDDVLPYVTICDDGDETGSYKLQADLKNVQDDETVGAFGFIMEKNTDEEESPYAYKITSCVNLDEDDADETDPETTDEEDADNTDETDPEQADANSTNTDQNQSDDPDETNAAPSDSGQNNNDQNNSSQNNNSQNNNSSQSGSSSGISQSEAQSAAQSYMEERVSDDGSSYSMSYSGTKNFDGVDYYSYSVTKKDSDGNSGYVTNIYVDAATGSDVWDEAN